MGGFLLGEWTCDIIYIQAALGGLDLGSGLQQART